MVMITLEIFSWSRSTSWWQRMVNDDNYDGEDSRPRRMVIVILDISSVGHGVWASDSQWWMYSGIGKWKLRPLSNSPHELWHLWLSHQNHHSRGELNWFWCIYGKILVPEWWTLFRFGSNIGYVLVRYTLSMQKLLVKFWLCMDQILVNCWSNIP